VTAVTPPGATARTSATNRMTRLAGRPEEALC
jgi:hypothetical protein